MKLHTNVSVTNQNAVMTGTRKTTKKFGTEYHILYYSSPARDTHCRHVNHFHSMDAALMATLINRNLVTMTGTRGYSRGDSFLRNDVQTIFSIQIPENISWNCRHCQCCHNNRMIVRLYKTDNAPEM